MSKNSGNRSCTMIFINSHARAIQMRKLPNWRSRDERSGEIFRLLGAGCGISTAYKFANGDYLWVDKGADWNPAPAFGFDLSQLHPSWPFGSDVRGWPFGSDVRGWPFGGDGVIVGRNLSLACTTIEEVRPHIRWFDLEECFQERCRIRGFAPRPKSSPDIES